jgi:predicted enzyme related to lactoylglutathione lyase
MDGTGGTVARHANETPVVAVMVPVADVQEGLRWYERAFPDARRETLDDPQEFEYLAAGNVMLEVVLADEKLTSAAAGSVVYWHAADFDTMLDHLLSVGATLHRGPRQIERGQKMCQVRDPWGNCIGLRGPSRSCS